MLFFFVFLNLVFKCNLDFESIQSDSYSIRSPLELLLKFKNVATVCYFVVQVFFLPPRFLGVAL